MPPSAAQNSLSQDLLSLGHDDTTRKPSPGRRGQGKSKRKHDYTIESPEKDGAHKVAAQDLTSPSSILSQLQESPFPSQSDTISNLDPSLEAYRAPRPIQHSENPRRSTADWTQRIPYGRSPPQMNDATIAGSPPGRRTPPEALKRGFSHASPPTSPRSAFRQPVHRNNGYQSFGNHLGASPPTVKPQSVYSNFSVPPPPPHHPQAHYYGAPDLDFGIPNQTTGQRCSEESYCCVFDSLSSVGNASTPKTENVLLVGSEHGLNVYHIDKSKLNHIGHLSGLRGSVIGAKILPGHLTGRSPLKSQPLVALIIHGPLSPTSANTGPNIHAAGPEEFDASGSTIEALHSVDTSHYQTTVEVYSLQCGDLVATIYKSPEIETQTRQYGAKPIAPPPVGSLSIQAKGRFVVVSSGTSGEVFIYERLQGNDEARPFPIRCIGKVWTKTSSKQVRSASMSSRDSGAMQEDDRTTELANHPVVCLSSRWLAVVPPGSSSQASIHGQVPESLGSKIPGVSSHTAPAEPQLTCYLDTPEGESFINKMARDATQELVKGARWVGNQGVQAWNSYWSKPSEPAQQPFAGSPPHNAYTMAPPAFPPTHAQERPPSRSRNQPALVSILDLEQLSHSQHLKETVALQPLATFSLPGGCSTLSFGPSGLQVLTASAKGDVQQVWDLMRLVHGEIARTRDPDAPSKGPSVREITRFTRITEARIIDVVWTTPKGGRLALVTDNGTVHIYDLPASAFYWPPLRRNKRVASAPIKPSSVESQDHQRGQSEPTGTAFGSALGMIAGKTQPLLSAVRGRTASAGSTFSGFGGFASTASGGGKAVAAGINRSFTAAASGTVNTIRHLGENRISLPGSSRAIVPGCVRWLGGKDEVLLAVTAAGLVRVHSIRQSNNPKAGRRRPSAAGRRPTEFAIPDENAVFKRPGSDAPPEISTSPGAFWLPPSSRPPSRTATQNVHPLSHAEIETHAPYQPFHTDRRVNFYVYDDNSKEDKDAHHLQGGDAWIFGEDIATLKISSGTTAYDEDELDATPPLVGQMENIISMQGNEEDGRQMVVTTRRRRNRKSEVAAIDDEDSEFFEEDLEFVDFADDRV
ncbi:MAG: hypothetical protein Q9217_004611 [Psora testacea]